MEGSQFLRREADLTQMSFEIYAKHQAAWRANRAAPQLRPGNVVIFLNGVRDGAPIPNVFEYILAQK